MRAVAAALALPFIISTLAACAGSEPAEPVGRIGLVSARSGMVAVWIMNVDGSQPSRLIDGFFPAWSADGREIVYSRRTADGMFDLFILSPETASNLRITDDPANDAHGSWSPDGQSIAFASDPRDNQDIYVVSPDSSGLTRLTMSDGPDQTPDWSPDGSKIVFGSFRGDNHDIYVMNADGSEQTRLTTDQEVDANPAWSPDGRKIAFDSFRTGTAQLYVMDSDGSGLRQLTFDADQSFGPVWSPDGEWIAFNRAFESGQNIVLLRADGSEEIRLDSPGSVFAWLTEE